MNNNENQAGLLTTNYQPTHKNQKNKKKKIVHTIF